MGRNTQRDSVDSKKPVIQRSSFLKTKTLIYNMCERKDTVVYTFDKESPTISTFDIHEWIYNHLILDENEVKIIQIDGPKRQVCVKFVLAHKLKALLDRTQGTVI